MELDELDEAPPRRLLWLGLTIAVVVVCLAGGFIAWTLNSDRVKLLLVEAVQHATGRALTISGATRFKLSLSPTVSMEDVALANPPGFSRPNMATVARVEVGLALLPLLQRRLEVDQVTLVRPDVLFETNAAGRGNWRFSRNASAGVPPAPRTAPVTADTPPAQPAQETGAVGGEDAAAQQRLAVWFSNASVEDGQIGWLDAGSGQHREARLTQLTVKAPVGEPAVLSGTATYAGRTISLSGRAEPTEVDDSAPGTGPWPVALKLETGDATLTVDGQIEQPVGGRGYVLAIDTEVPDPSILASWFPGLPLAALKSVSAHAEVTDSGGPAPTISKAQIKVASVDLGLLWSALGDGATLQNLTIGAKGDEPIRIVGGITRDGIDSGINGVVGDLHWLSGGASGPVPVDLEWNASSARASIKGTVDAPTRLAGLALDVAVAVPKPLQVTPGAPPALRAVAFQTKLTDAPGPVPFQFTSNAGDLTGQWSLTRLAKSSGPAFSVDAQVASQRLDLDMLLAHPSGATPAGTAAPAQADAPTGPGQAGAASPTDKPLIPTTALPFQLLHEIDARIKLALADVRFHGVDFRNIDSAAAVNDGQLRVAPFSIAAPDQQMSGTLLADATKTPPVVHLTVNAPALAAQPLLGALGLPEVATGTAQVQADLTGAGDSPHAIAATLDGWIGVAIEGGQLNTKMMNDWLDQVQPLHFSGPDETDLRCLALRADLKSGIATIAPVALNTPALIVDGTGDVDLGRETLTLEVRPRARIGGTGIAVPVRVSGPLREPSAKIDISAKGFGHGLSGLLLGGKDIMGAAGGGDPCPAALARAREAAPAPGAKP